MVRYADLVEETATYADGVFTLGGARDARRTFAASGFVDDDRVFVRAQGADGTWEVFFAEYAAGTLMRLDVLASSVGGDAVAFAAEVVVACVRPAVSGVAVGWPGMPPAAVDGGVAIGPNAAAAAAGVAVGYEAAAGVEGGVAIGQGVKAWAPFMTSLPSGVFVLPGEQTFTNAGTPSAYILLPFSWGDYWVGGSIIGEIRIVARNDSGGSWFGTARAAVDVDTGYVTLVGGSPTVDVIDGSGGAGLSATIAAGLGGIVVNVISTTGDWEWACHMIGTGLMWVGS
ncbi:hypothetical protein [Pseudothauera rhizosphaerae]|uniref:Uncharacterized protein n=1 Tax=Pseudothauera rhizosphaerae TaxID=2565932 RepID=A0A4S4AMP7_9RHOO|nr:hypothetical protein [Pseudothauera rhizosphaerae]THF60902.1 hypothetical protein E6O51_11775 [Pseudothauera rhizosphaerae]